MYLGDVDTHAYVYTHVCRCVYVYFKPNAEFNCVSLKKLLRYLPVSPLIVKTYEEKTITYLHVPRA